MWSIVVFSFVINLLYLTGPLFMLQIYDRVLASANIPTLLGLLFIVVVLYVFFGVLEFIRSQVIASNGEAITETLADASYRVSVASSCEANPSLEKASALEDVDRLRSFLKSPTFSALFDLPWAPIFLLFVFGLHPMLGVIATIAAAVLAGLAIVNERLSRKNIAKATSVSTEARKKAQYARRNAVSLRGNGMVGAVGQLWRGSDREARQIGLRTGAINSGFSTATKTLRLAIQSVMLAAGAYFVIQGELSAGGIVAGSIIFSRALAPLEQILSNYTQLARARDSYANLNSWWSEEKDVPFKEGLPPPERSVEVSGLGVCAPGVKQFIIAGITFGLESGDVLGVSGASGSGKSTLAKAIVGAWPCTVGKVCLDGAELSQWSEKELGAHVGYLPQDIELFNHTVASNIARCRGDADFEKVLEASKLAGTHEMILSLPDGYNTVLGEGGVSLSAGQRQRVALARALYGNPFLVVLDEPNSNLDEQGEKALAQAVDSLRLKGRIVIVIAHRQNILNRATKLLVMEKGQMKVFGKPEDLVKAMKAQAAAGAKPKALASTRKGNQSDV
ncbi:type I secretion system ATPase subfamily [Verrucomicrobiia bacterium DG1235]|nr:type I secretion system ATPase subfamily [Verrucomicrobiae bacterium DG1235]